MPQLSRTSSLLLVVGAVLSALAGCRLFRTADKCAIGPGLKAEAYSGAQLADMTLTLSFDGGPSAAADELGVFLAAQGIQATFFVYGAEVGQGEDVLARLKSQGHLIGNGGYSASRLTRDSDPAVEVRRTDELIVPYVTGNMYLLRPYEGAFSKELAEQLNAAGLTRYTGPIGWDIGKTATDFKDDRVCLSEGHSVDTCLQHYLKAIRSAKRGIVRLHAERRESVQLVRELVEKLKDEGFSFVRLDAVTSVRLALEQAGAMPGAVGGPAGCSEY